MWAGPLFSGRGSGDSAGPMVGGVSEGGALGPEACPNWQVTLGFPKTTKREGISRVRASPELSTPRFCVRATPTTSTAGRRQEESQTQGAEGLGIPS